MSLLLPSFIVLKLPVMQFKTAEQLFTARWRPTVWTVVSQRSGHPSWDRSGHHKAHKNVCVSSLRRRAPLPMKMRTNAAPITPFI